MKVNFKIIDAEEEKANVEATEEKYFVIVAPIVWLDNNVLTIYFEYKKYKK